MNLSYKDFLFFILSVILYMLMVHDLNRSSAIDVFLVFTALFAIYVVYIKVRKHKHNNSGERDFKRIVVLAVLLRLIFIDSIPILSDDIYRFLWDGQLTLGGYNPFLYLPSTLSSDHVEFMNPVTMELLGKMNSPNYYTVYPPVLQYIFLACTSLFPSGVHGEIIVFRMLILLAEVVTFFAIRNILLKLNKDINLLAWYAFNPLIIIELTGNLHPEAFMICFLSIAIMLMLNKKHVASGIFFALAIATKLIPLILLPVLLYNMHRKGAFKFIFSITVTLILLVLPFANVEIIENFFSSIDLYFRSFEFNGGIYLWLREVGFAIDGYNRIDLIGPMLACLSFIVIMFISFRKKTKELSNVFTPWLLVLTVYFLCATTVHPWYLSTLLFIAIIGNKKSYMICWTFLAFSSYLQYEGNVYHEEIWLITAEYLILIACITHAYLPHKGFFKKGIVD